jgi:hypothetical protein
MQESNFAFFTPAYNWPDINLKRSVPFWCEISVFASGNFMAFEKIVPILTTTISPRETTNFGCVGRRDTTFRNLTRDGV